MQVYQTICEFLIQGWRSLGIDLHYGQAGRGYIHNPNCFGTATGADLVTSEGVKLIGSAQLRRGGAILQHGSIRLTTDPTLFQQVFGVELDPLTLPILQSEDTLTQMEAALIAAAHRWFGIELLPQPLTQAEWEAIGLHCSAAGCGSL
jgi:lipoate-protein ligase A